MKKKLYLSFLVSILSVLGGVSCLPSGVRAADGSLAKADSAEDRITAEKLIKEFSLEQHPEGGWFSEVYTAGKELGVLPDGRCLAGSIYFLLQGKDISHFHQIDCDEIWYYHAGCGLVIHLVSPDGRYEKKYLGMDDNALPMVIVPKGTIFAAENISTSSYTFISCMTAPKFRYTGFRMVKRPELQELALPERLFIE